MSVLTQQEKQVVDLFQQLPPERRSAVILELIGGDADAWKHYRNEGQNRLRELAAEQGEDWDRLTDEQRQDFVCAILNENRA
jgi:hypothetical protein